MICLEHILLTNVKRIVSKLYYLNSRLLIINTQYSSADICNVSHLQSDDRLCNNLHSWGPLPCSLGTSQRDQRLCKTIKLYYIGVCVMCTMYLISLHVHRSKRILNIPVFFPETLLFGAYYFLWFDTKRLDNGIKNLHEKRFLQYIYNLWMIV